MDYIRSKRVGIDKTHTIIYRSPDNQAGLAPNYDQVDSRIPSPTKFENQTKRSPFSKKGVFGPQILDEKRFVANPNDLTTVRSKYTHYGIPPDFSKWANHSLDEFIGNSSSIANENANNQTYFPKFHLVEPNYLAGLPDFAKYSPRTEKKRSNPLNDSIEPSKVISGFHATVR